MIVTKYRQFVIFVTIPWLQLQDVAVLFASYMIMFGWQHGISHCHNASVTVQGVTQEPWELVYTPGKHVFK